MRAIWIGSGAVLLALAACDVPPEGTTPEDIARFEAAAATIGCDMVTEADYLPVELQAGMTREQSQDIVGFLLRTDRAVRLEGGGARITSGPCAPTA